MNAQIRIVSLSGGDRTEFRFEGSAVFSEDRARVSYIQENDRVTLLASPAGLNMTREGETGLSAYFSEGSHDSFKLSLNGHEAELPLRTERYSFLPGNGSLCVRLFYKLLMGDLWQSFGISIFVTEHSEGS